MSDLQKCHKCKNPVPKHEVYSDFYYCETCMDNFPLDFEEYLRDQEFLMGTVKDKDVKGFVSQ